jgi:hypothetical protein
MDRLIRRETKKGMINHDDFYHQSIYSFFSTSARMKICFLGGIKTRKIKKVLQNLLVFPKTYDGEGYIHGKDFVESGPI